MSKTKVEVRETPGSNWIELVLADKSHPLAGFVVVECVRYAFPDVCELLNLERVDPK